MYICTNRLKISTDALVNRVGLGSSKIISVIM